MEFCTVCNNMLYFKVSDQTTLVKYCKNCNFSTEDKCDGKAVVLIDNYMGANEQYYEQYKSKYIEFDSTLPRVNNIPCDNKDCSNKDPEKNEVIYIKYDHKNMKYLYYCTHCKSFWI